VGLHNSGDNGKTKARPYSSGLGGEKRIENMGRNASGNSRAIIGDLDRDTVRGYAASPDADRAAATRLADSLLGVDDEVQQYLLHLPSIGQYRRQRGIKIKLDVNVSEFQFIIAKGQRALSDVIQIHWLAAGIGFTGT
jgi:hypothetical protein